MPYFQLLYPVMQCADIFFLGVDVCQLGMDQRKVNMLARDHADKKGVKKPIILSHPMLPGLKEGQEKMSKSEPASAIFMENAAKDVEKKIKGAYCPPKEVDKNPVLAYYRHLIFPSTDSVTIKRPTKFGGNVTFKSYDEFTRAYMGEQLHPGDVKVNLARLLNEKLEPVRQHFQEK